MHVFIPVHYRAPRGGLQDHVISQVRAVVQAGSLVTVMAPPGPFGNLVEEAGGRFLPASDADASEDARRAIVESGEPFDLVHAHPFRARETGLAVARQLDIPFVLTLHSLYSDHLSSYADDVSMVVAVSHAIRDRLLEEGAIAPQRITVIPNGVDIDRFGTSRGHPASAERRHVLVASRLDRDKAYILDAVCSVWRRLADCRVLDIEWTIAGDGTERQRLETLAAELAKRIGRDFVHFAGWLSADRLAEAYSGADLCIAPGRCALESLASATATIAIGSKGYVGVVDGPTALLGVYSNFGGLGDGNADPGGEALFRDFDRIVYDGPELQRLGRLGHDLAAAYFNQADVDRRLLELHALIRSTSVRKPKRCTKWTAEPGLAPEWSDTAWCVSGAVDEIDCTVDEAAWVRLDSRLGDAARTYLRMGKGSFRRAGSAAVAVGCRERYAVGCEVKVDRDELWSEIWWIEYDARGKRIRHQRQRVRTGSNRLEVVTDGRAARARIAVRVAGSGSVCISPLTVERERVEISRVEARRSLAPRDESDYRGQNLIFIVGPPRSGTTWLLQLLSAHRNVVAATEDNLGIAAEQRETLETNVFNDNRPFTDSQIRRRFHKLSLQHGDCFVVEKTPIHLLFAERIRGVFPDAALVLVDRDVRDIVHSLVCVGRDADSWWKGAPASVSAAFRLWYRYASAATQVRERHDPLIVTYEALHSNTASELERLFAALGLDSSSVPEIVEVAENGRSIPIRGVFREGRVGAWRDGLSGEEVEELERLLAHAVDVAS